MLTEVRLFATFREGRFKTRSFEVAEGITLLEIINMVGIEPEEVALPLVNGKFSPLDRKIMVEDVVSLFPAVGGG